MNGPTVEQRDEAHYVAIRAQVTMEEMIAVLPEFWPEIHSWLAAQSEAPVGAPFIRYLEIARDSDRYDIEVGIPVSQPLAGEGRIGPGVFSPGRYATVVHAGPYDGLAAASYELHTWVESNGMQVDETETAGGMARSVQVESYLTDPGEVPDPANWQTQISYLLV